MNSSSESIFIGVVSGILTSALIYLIVSVFEKIVVPWYQAIIYRGVDINGEWEMTSTKSKQSGVFNIEQKAHRITGVATFIKEETDSKIESIRAFDIEGQVSERFVTLVLKHKNKQRLGIGSYLIQIIGDGRKMMGYLSAYDIKASNITSDACEFTRKDK